MTSILRTQLDDNYTLCQQLFFNVFVENGYEIDFWIERKSDKKHFDLNDIFDREKNEIEQRLRMRFTSKFLSGIQELKKINKTNFELLGLK